MWCISTVLCLLLFFGYYYHKAVHDPFVRVPMSIEGDFDIEKDDEIGFIATRNAYSHRFDYATNGDYEIFTDGRSARVNVRGEQTPSTVDVLTIGGSFSRGHGLPNEETFTSKLGSKYQLRVANFALGSYGTTQSLQMLKRNIDLSPAVIIYGLIEHHLTRNIQPCAPSFAPLCLATSFVEFEDEQFAGPYIHRPLFEYATFEQNRDFYQKITKSEEHVGVADVLWKIRIDYERLTRKRDLKPWEKYHSGGYDERKKAAFGFLMREMSMVAADIGAVLVVVYIPDMTPSTVAKPSSSIQEVVKENNLIFVDTTAAIIKHYEEFPEKKLYLHESDDHPNALAHSLIAEELETAIIEHGLLEKLQ